MIGAATPRGRTVAQTQSAPLVAALLRSVLDEMEGWELKAACHYSKSRISTPRSAGAKS